MLRPLQRRHRDATIHIHDLPQVTSDFRSEVLAGLSTFPKKIPPKFLYNDKGSELFEQITRLDEYYLTRVEKGLLASHATEIGKWFGANSCLLDFGPGSGEKTKTILNALQDPLEYPQAYIPVDISREHLTHTAEEFHRLYPELMIHTICGDFSHPLRLSRTIASIIDSITDLRDKMESNIPTLFLGSTIGNMEPDERLSFLKELALTLGEKGGLLLGVDLTKDSSILEKAYNDSTGVTAQFNLNLLTRMNDEIGAKFNLTKFNHRAFYNTQLARIEMHIQSLEDQIVSVDERPIVFRKGETIHTENSYKFSIERIRQMALDSGWSPRSSWTDPAHLFSLNYWEVKRT